MEGLVLRQPLTCSAAASSSSYSKAKLGCLRVGRNKKESEFREKGHLQFYGAGNKKEKKSIKHKLKLLKSLSNFSHADDQHALLLQETAQGLMTHLQHLKAKHKEERKLAKLNSAKGHKSRFSLQSESSSSSSSSESSDSDGCIDMNRAAHQPLPTQDCSPPPLAIGTNAAEETKKIEVCMGNKCRKLGAGVLLEEFERVLGGEAAVVGCKCMGKCRDGPNVRLRNSPLPLCLGVALEDVDVIASNLLRQDVPSVS